MMMIDNWRYDHSWLIMVTLGGQTSNRNCSVAIATENVLFDRRAVYKLRDPDNHLIARWAGHTEKPGGWGEARPGWHGPVDLHEAAQACHGQVRGRVVSGSEASTANLKVE